MAGKLGCRSFINLRLPIMQTLKFVLLFLLAFTALAPAQEYIIVSGGPSLRKWEDYRVPEEQHDRYAGNFIKAAHHRMTKLRQANPAIGQFTWLIYRPAYAARDREDAVRRPPYTCTTGEIQQRAAQAGARIVWFSTKDEVINYLNNRSQGKIAHLDFFVHSNKYAFLFDYSSEILGVSTCYLHSVDLKRLRKGLFLSGATVQSWGCHTAEYMSAVWKRTTGVPLIGAIGKTDYRAIGDNVSLPACNSWSR